MPKPDVFGFIAPSAGSSVTAVAPLADSHLSNEASEPVAVPSKMYSNPGSGGGAVYWRVPPTARVASVTSAVERYAVFHGASLPRLGRIAHDEAYAFRPRRPKVLDTGAER